MAARKPSTSILPSMTPSTIKRPTRFGLKGTTFVEALAVTVVIAGVLATAGSSFIFGLKSYVGEYASEIKEIEMQRAAAEIAYFSSRALRFSVGDDAGELSSGALLGYQAKFYDVAGQEIVFAFAPDADQTGVGYVQGTFSVSWPGSSYVYSTEARFPTTGGQTRPFSLSSTGGLSYHLEVDTAGGPIAVCSVVIPRGVL